MTEAESAVSDPHSPLREDVNLLGRLLGEILVEQEGEDLFETVERVRRLSKKAHREDGGEFDPLRQLLEELPEERALCVAREFSKFLTLANQAEQHHRVRRRRQYQRDEDSPAQRGSCESDGADTLQVLDGRRPRRKSNRHLRGDASGLSYVAVDGRRFVLPGGGRAAGRAVGDGVQRRASRGGGRGPGAVSANSCGACESGSTVRGPIWRRCSAGRCSIGTRSTGRPSSCGSPCSCATARFATAGWSASPTDGFWI